MLLALLCVWMCGWEEVVVFGDADESRMLGVKLCFDGFVGVYVVDELVVDRRKLVSRCLS